MSDHNHTNHDVKPGTFVSWIMPLLVIVALITFLSVYISKHPSGGHSETHEKETTHAEA